MIQELRFWVCIQRIESRVPKRYLHSHVHSSISYNSLKVGAAQVSVNR